MDGTGTTATAAVKDEKEPHRLPITMHIHRICHAFKSRKRGLAFSPLSVHQVISFAFSYSFPTNPLYLFIHLSNNFDRIFSIRISILQHRISAVELGSGNGARGMQH